MTQNADYVRRLEGLTLYLAEWLDEQGVDFGGCFDADPTGFDYPLLLQLQDQIDSSGAV